MKPTMWTGMFLVSLCGVDTFIRGTEGAELGESTTTETTTAESTTSTIADIGGTSNIGAHCGFTSYFALSNSGFISRISNSSTTADNVAAMVAYLEQTVNTLGMSPCLLALINDTTNGVSDGCASVCGGSADNQQSMSCLWCNFLFAFRVTASLSVTHNVSEFCSTTDVAALSTLNPVPVETTCDLTTGCLNWNIDAGVRNQCRAALPSVATCTAYCAVTNGDPLREASCTLCYQITGIRTGFSAQTKVAATRGPVCSATELAVLTGVPAGWTACLSEVPAGGTNAYILCVRGLIANARGTDSQAQCEKQMANFPTNACRGCTGGVIPESCLRCTFGLGIDSVANVGVINGSSGSCAAASDLNELTFMQLPAFTWCMSTGFYSDPDECFAVATGKTNPMCTACLLDQLGSLRPTCDQSYCNSAGTDANAVAACRLCYQAAGMQAATNCQNITFTTTTTTTTTIMTTILTTEGPETTTMTDATTSTSVVTSTQAATTTGTTKVSTTTTAQTSTPTHTATTRASSSSTTTTSTHAGEVVFQNISSAYSEQYGNISVDSVLGGVIDSQSISAAQTIISSLPEDIATFFSGIASSTSSSDLTGDDAKNLRLLVGVASMSTNSTVGQLVAQIIAGVSLTTHQANIGALIDSASNLSAETVSVIASLVSGDVSSSDTLSRVSDVVVGASTVGPVAAATLLQLASGNFTEADTALSNMQAVLSSTDLTSDAIGAFVVIAGGDTDNKVLASLSSVLSSVAIGSDAVVSISSALGSGLTISVNDLLTPLSSIPICSHVPTHALEQLLTSVIGSFDLDAEPVRKAQSVVPLSWILLNVQ